MKPPPSPLLEELLPSLRELVRAEVERVLGEPGAGNGRRSEDFKLDNIMFETPDTAVGKPSKRRQRDLDRPRPEQEYLSSRQAANLVGCAGPTLRRWGREGRVRVLRAGRHFRFHRDDLLKMLEAAPEEESPAERAERHLAARWAKVSK